MFRFTRNSPGLTLLCCLLLSIASGSPEIANSAHKHTESIGAAAHDGHAPGTEPAANCDDCACLGGHLLAIGQTLATAEPDLATLFAADRGSRADNRYFSPPLRPPID